MEDRNSELENKTEIKVKTEEMLVRQLKTCEGICRNSLTPSNY
jgi:hypothetical protein